MNPRASSMLPLQVQIAQRVLGLLLKEYSHEEVYCRLRVIAGRLLRKIRKASRLRVRRGNTFPKETDFVARYHVACEFVRGLLENTMGPIPFLDWKHYLPANIIAKTPLLRLRKTRALPSDPGKKLKKCYAFMPETTAVVENLQRDVGCCVGLHMDFTTEDLQMVLRRAKLPNCFLEDKTLKEKLAPLVEAASRPKTVEDLINRLCGIVAVLR